MVVPKSLLKHSEQGDYIHDSCHYSIATTLPCSRKDSDSETSLSSEYLIVVKHVHLAKRQIPGAVKISCIILRKKAQGQSPVLIVQISNLLDLPGSSTELK